MEQNLVGDVAGGIGYSLIVDAVVYIISTLIIFLGTALISAIRKGVGVFEIIKTRFSQLTTFDSEKRINFFVKAYSIFLRVQAFIFVAMPLTAIVFLYSFWVFNSIEAVQMFGDDYVNQEFRLFYSPFSIFNIIFAIVLTVFFWQLGGIVRFMNSWIYIFTIVPLIIIEVFAVLGALLLGAMVLLSYVLPEHVVGIGTVLAGLALLVFGFRLSVDSIRSSKEWLAERAIILRGDTFFELLPWGAGKYDYY